jgi:predicted nuclease with TOPRIM domain
VNQTKAETQVPTMIPGVNPSTESAVGIGGAFSLLVWAILHFRRKGTEIIKDRTEGKLVETLMLERDGAKASEREAWTKVNELSVTNARLEAQNQYQKEEIDRLKELVEELQKQFDEVKLRLQHLSQGATGHSGFTPHM